MAINEAFTSEAKVDNIPNIDAFKDAKDKINWQVELELEELKQGFGKALNGKKVVISAGPTYEKIDDVRFIGNYSSGKMGFALAKVAYELGAEVFLISGPVALQTPNEKIHRIDVVSAEEMFQATIKEFPNCDIAIMSAAVADFTPTNKFSGKMKKARFGRCNEY